MNNNCILKHLHNVECNSKVLQVKLSGVSGVFIVFPKKKVKFGYLKLRLSWNGLVVSKPNKRVFSVLRQIHIYKYIKCKNNTVRNVSCQETFPSHNSQRRASQETDCSSFLSNSGATNANLDKEILVGPPYGNSEPN